VSSDEANEERKKVECGWLDGKIDRYLESMRWDEKKQIKTGKS
jgi:hypothetical protein